MKKSVVFLAAVVLCGCASGFDRAALRERLASAPLQVTEADIKAALDLKPQLRFPFKLGVYLQTEERGPNYTYPSGVRSGEWSWSASDKERIVSWRTALVNEGVVSDLFIISDLIASGTDLKRVRLAAARYGADAVLIIQGASQVDRYLNPLSFFYLTIVPGTNIDAIMMLQGAMWETGISTQRSMLMGKPTQRHHP